jgi:hypothetical protein
MNKKMKLMDLVFSTSSSMTANLLFSITFSAALPLTAVDGLP